MRKIALLSLLLIFTLLFSFQSCKGKEETLLPKNAIEEVVQTPIPTEFESKLRPNEKLKLGITYIDTVKYVAFNDDADDFYFIVEKNKDTIALLFNSDEYKYIRGEEIEIKWEIDSMRYAGDDSYLNFTEHLYKAKKLKSLKLTDKKTKFLWRENLYNKELKANFNSIVLNENYIAQISEPEKAALAYVSTFVGNECGWDGTAAENRTNLKCKILSALDLGYQCSYTHLELIRYWFRNDKDILKEIENCPTTPDGATIQDTFDEITIETKGNQITVYFKANGINMREGTSWSWDEKHYFEFKNNELILKEKAISPVVHDTFEVRGN
ncbi:hypothetical protein ACFSX9_11840 [Flavobacterium ardleyense]|uniref:Lipoprotein n=1 Tax=Flavobacterium ardleyense TaxID=2038737 RepID=A0ABW5Z973_9FLAO